MLHRYFLVGSLFLLVTFAGRADDLPRGDAKSAGFSAEKLDGINAILKKAVEKKQISGGSALIARHGKVVYVATAGMQDIEAKVPLSERTIFRIASMSKPITSVAIMQLVDDGKLSVTDPLSKFVPEFKSMKVLVPSQDGKAFETVDAQREITIHDLLTHSSGITYGIMNKPFHTKLYADAGVSDGLTAMPGTIGDNVKKLARLPLVCQPGAAWEYGLNTDVLGHIVEVVSGQSLEQFFAERLFKPLQMNDTYFNLPKDKRSRLAALYNVAEDKALVPVGEKPLTLGPVTVAANVPTRDDNKYFSGGAGLVSTIGDYFRFCQMILNGGELDGVRVIKADTLKTMLQNQLGKIPIPFPGSGAMGYGFGVLTASSKESSKDPAGVGTSSWGGAFGTYFWIDPANKLVGVFMSQMFPPDFSLGTEFKKLTYEAMAESK